MSNQGYTWSGGDYIPIEVLDEKLSQAESQLKSLHDDLETKRARLEEVEGFPAEIEKLKRELDDKRKAKEALDRKIPSLEIKCKNAGDELEMVETEKSALEVQKQKVEWRLNSVKSEYENGMQKLQIQLDEKRASVDGLRKSLQQLHIDKTVLMEQIKEKKAELNKKKLEVAILTMKLQSDIELGSLSAQIEDEGEEEICAQLAQKVAELQDEKDEVFKFVSCGEERIEDLKNRQQTALSVLKKFNELEKQSLGQIFEEKRAKLLQLEAEVTVLLDRKGMLNTTIASLNDDIHKTRESFLMQLKAKDDTEMKVPNLKKELGRLQLQQQHQQEERQRQQPQNPIP